MQAVVRWFQGKRFARVLVFGMSVALLVMLYLRIKLIPFHVFNMGGVDQNIVQGTLRVLLGLPLYGDPEVAPFPIVQYAPLYFYLHAWVASWWQLGAEQVQDIYVTGRALCLALNLLTMLVVMQVARVLVPGRIMPFLAGAFFLTSLTDMYYLRPDSLYMLLFWAHVLVFIKLLRAEQAQRTRLLVLAALFAVLAIFSKQSGLIIPVMGGAYFLIRRRWRELFRYTLITIGWTAVVLLLLFVDNDPMAVYRNVVLGNVNGTDVMHLLDQLRSRYGLPILGWMLIGLAVSVRVLRTAGDGPRTYLAVAVVLGFCWALLTGLKVGSNSNYYTEAQMLTVILCMLVLSDVVSATRSTREVLFMTLLAGTALLRTSMYFSAFEITKFRRDEPSIYAEEYRMASRIRAHGLQEGDHVFLVNRGYGELLLAPHTVLNAKDIVLVSGDRLRMDLSAFWRMLEAGEVKYVIAPSALAGDVPAYEHVRFTEHVPLFTEGAHTVYVRRSDRDNEGAPVQ